MKLAAAIVTANAKANKRKIPAPLQPDAATPTGGAGVAAAATTGVPLGIGILKKFVPAHETAKNDNATATIVAKPDALDMVIPLLGRAVG